MKSNLKFFNQFKTLPIDKFFSIVLYNKNYGYYSSKNPFGPQGDFITAPRISRLFSETIAIWLISTWKNLGKPKIFNIVELGPGDGSLTKVLLDVFKKFPEFNLSKKIYLYEISKLLVNKQKRMIKDPQVNWINDFGKIKKGPVVFFGNEFFDAIPIKQFKRDKKNLLEKHFTFDENYKIKGIFKNAKTKDLLNIKSFKSLSKLKFIEFPKLGLKELKKIIFKINKLKGCILLVDYGYLNPHNHSTLQSVIKHKKNNLLDNLGKADVTSQVNFKLLSEFFSKNNLKVKNIIKQKDFLKNMGILERAEIISRKMKFSEKSDLYFRLKRLISPKSMGDLFKVILAHNFENGNFYGFK